MEQMILTVPLLIGGIFAGLYLISHRRLLNRLKKEYPEKWKQLGEPEFSDDSDARDIKRFLRFLTSADDIENADLIKMKAQTKTFLLIGAILIGGALSYWILRFLISILFIPE